MSATMSTNPMMGNMQPTNPMQLNTMPMMMGMPMPMMMMGKMKCTVTPNGMTWEVSPIDNTSKELFAEYCKTMAKNMTTMPVAMSCGGIMMMCMTTTTA